MKQSITQSIVWRSCIALLLLFATLPAVLADWQDDKNCVYRTPCPIIRLLVNESLTPLPGASCNITIRNQTSITVNGTPMTDQGNGYYNFTYTPNATGFHPADMLCFGQGDLARQDISFVASKKGRLSLFEVAIPFFMLALAVLLLFFTHYFLKDILQGWLKWLTVGGVITVGMFIISGGLAVLSLVLAYEGADADVSLTAMARIVDTLYIVTLYIGYSLALAFFLTLIIKIYLGIKDWQKNTRRI